MVFGKTHEADQYTGSLDTTKPNDRFRPLKAVWPKTPHVSQLPGDTTFNSAVFWATMFA